MPTSVFLAQLIGPVFLAVSIGVLVNTTAYRNLAEEFLDSDALIYVSGLFTMTAGVAIILVHDVWAADWRILITLLGWLGTIGGAVRIVLPQLTESIGRRMLERPAAIKVAGLIWLAVGAVFCFYGYFR